MASSSGRLDKSGDAYYSKYIDATGDKNVMVLSDRITLEESDLESWRIINTYYSPKSVSVMTIFPLVDNRNEDKKENYIQNVQPKNRKKRKYSLIWLLNKTYVR